MDITLNDDDFLICRLIFDEKSALFFEYEQPKHKNMTQNTFRTPLRKNTSVGLLLQS